MASSTVENDFTVVQIEEGLVDQDSTVEASKTGKEDPVLCNDPSGSRPTGEQKKETRFRTDKLGLYRKTRGKQSKYAQEVKKVIKPGSLGGYQDHNRENKGQWRGIARTPRIKELLYDTATMLGHISVEATQAAHYHVYRCLEEGIDLGKMDYNGFWYKIFDAIKDLRYGGGLQQNIRTPLYDSLRRYAEVAPLRQAGESRRWAIGGHKAWRQDCLKAVAKTKEQNLGIILQHNAYHNLGKIIKVRVVRTFGSRYADIFRSLVSAIAKALWEGIDFREVKEGYKRLQDLSEEELGEIQKNIVNPIQENFPDQASRKENSKMIKFVHFVVGEVIQYNGERFQQPNPGNTAQATEFADVCMGENLAIDIERELREGSLSKKKFVLYMKHALDIFRQCSGSDLFTTRRDQGISDRDNRQGTERNEKYRGQILCLLSDRILYQSQAGGARFLHQGQVRWINDISSELRLPSPLSQFEMNKNDFAEYIQRRILPKLRSSFLLVEQRGSRNANATWGKRIEVPSILPLAKKRACHVSIPNDAIIKFAESLATEDKTIADKIEGAKTSLREAEEKEGLIKAEIVKTNMASLSDSQCDMLRQLEANKRNSKSEFKRAPTAKQHRYTMSEEEKDLHKDLKDKDNRSLNDSEEYKDARKRVDEAKLRYQECCWASLFNIKVRKCQDGHQWLFGGQLSTDGVDVSLQYYRLKTDAEIAADEEEKEKRKDREAKKEKESSEGNTRKRKRTKKKDGTGIQSSQNSVSQGNLERAKELLDQSPDRAWVFDPGPSGHVGIKLDQGKMRILCEENKRHGDYEPFETMNLSNYEMRTRAGILKRKALEQVWTQRSPDVDVWKQQAPTRKVRTAGDVLDFCRLTNDHLNTVYAFYSQNCFRRQRFSVYTRTQRMLDSMVERICGTSEREIQSRTVVVFGNASINSGKHGKERICFRALLDLLRQRCCFIEIDEFRSSQYCCACHTKLESPPAVGLHKRWKVRRCTNNGCERAFWQRDVNAAINLAKFFLWEVNGQEKAEVFQRPQKLEEEDISEV